MFSICTIVKNEHKYIEGFIKAIKSVLPENAYEVILVDTGSDDDTVEIASKYLDNVYHYDWSGDFSAAKNYAISLASNNLVLSLDCDEYISVAELNAIKQFEKSYSNSLGVITLVNHTGSGDEKETYTEELPRLFDRRYFRYEGIVHEQLKPVDDAKVKYTRVPIAVNHYGYMGTPEELKKKTDRNNELLFKELEANPDDPYVYFQLGQSYAVIKDYENAYTYFSRGLEFDVDPRLEYVIKMVTGYGYAMLDTGRLDEAMGLLSVYEDFKEDIEFVTMIGLLYLKSEMLSEACEEFVRVDKMAVINPYDEAKKNVARYNLGVINEVMGNTKEAIDFYKKCVSYPNADLRIAQLKH